MKKIDLTQVKFLDIEGNEAMFDIARVLGNIMYMHGDNIVEKELGYKIYHSADPLGEYNPNIGWKPKADEPHPDCSFEIKNEEEEKALMKFVEKQYSYILREAVKEALKSE